MNKIYLSAICIAEKESYFQKLIEIAKRSTTNINLSQ